MILYIFNNYFLDDSGFSKRCNREIDMLSQKNDITIICRKKDNKNSIYKSVYRKIKVIGFDLQTSLLETPKNYIGIIYEIIRTFALFRSIAIVLCTCILEFKRKKLDITLYVVVSPITLPLFCLLIAKLFGITKTVIEFHDMEPEMAIHMKHITQKNIIVRIEYFLEKFLCKQFKKVVVTNSIQKKILQMRTNISADKIFILPNILDNMEKKSLLLKDNSSVLINRNDFIIGYISTLTFEYTYQGLQETIYFLPDIVKKYPDIKILIIGGGDGVQFIKDTIKMYSLEENILLTGIIKNVSFFLERIDVGIIPYKKDIFTQTVLPTKLFEYLAHKKPVIAPAFGAFQEVLQDQDTALLYTSFADLTKKIVQLYEQKNTRERIAQNGQQMYLKKYTLIHYYKAYNNFITL